MCQESNLAFVMIIACRLISAESFFLYINADLWFGIFWYQNLCRFMVGMLSVCYWFEFGIVGLLSVTIPALCQWSVFNRCHVGYLSVSKSGDSIPNLTPLPKWHRHEPHWLCGVFSNIVGGRQLADSLKILRFCRFRVALAGVTGV